MHESESGLHKEEEVTGGTFRERKDAYMHSLLETGRGKELAEARDHVKGWVDGIDFIPQNEDAKLGIYGWPELDIPGEYVTDDEDLEFLMSDTVVRIRYGHLQHWGDDGFDYGGGWSYINVRLPEDGKVVFEYEDDPLDDTFRKQLEDYLTKKITG